MERIITFLKNPNYYHTSDDGVEFACYPTEDVIAVILGLKNPKRTAVKGTDGISVED